MRAEDRKVYFALLSYRTPEESACLKVLQSLVFQICLDEPDLRSVIYTSYRSNYRRLKTDIDFLAALLSDLLSVQTHSYLVIDGLDEVDAPERQSLLTALSGIVTRSSHVRLFISSRTEDDLSNTLISDCITLRVDRNNLLDIEAYVRRGSAEVMERMRQYGADDHTCTGVQHILNKVASKAQGMFLYARLVLSVVCDADNLQDIQYEVDNLPDGLEEAYGRILARIKTLRRREKEAARKILTWVGCVKRQLREEEVLQALAIEIGVSDFTKGPKVFRNICKTCGPILEIKHGTVQFVHFTVQE
jgi:hypothetical protein